MKKNEIQELKRKPDTELTRLLSDAREKLRNLRFELAQGKVKNISEISETRKTIARINTFLSDATKAK
jgi:large subunit ribosomal protein L29